MKFSGPKKPEAKARDWVKKRIKDRYGKDCWCLTTHQGPYGQKGVPDLIYCIHGLFVAIEMKSEVGEATAIQMVELRKIQKANGISCIIHGKDDVMLQRLFNAIDRRVEQLPF